MAELQSPAPELRFAADIMLGRLAKWLRIIGEDVIYGRHLTGYGLIRAARLENRLILTRPELEKQTTAPELVPSKRSLSGAAQASAARLRFNRR